MIAKYILFIAVSVIASGISLVLAGVAFRHRDRIGASGLGWLMLGVAGWCLTSGLGLLVKSEAAAYLALRIAYLFFTVVPVLWIRFTFQFVAHYHPPDPRLLNLLWIAPIISMSLVWTNQWHYWFWQELEFHWLAGFLTWKAVFGPGFWLHTLYSYCLMLLGALNIIRYSTPSFAVYRMQIHALLIGCLAPFLASLPAVLGLTTLPLTPFGLVITGLIFTWGIFRSGLLHLRPIARDLLIEQVGDGMIIVDERQIVVDLNSPALKLLGGDESRILGSPADKVLRSLTGRDFHIQKLAQFQIEITLLQQDQECHYTLAVSPLQGLNQQAIGCLIHLHDITSLKNIEAALRASESRSRAIIAALPDSVHIINQDGYYLDSQETWENLDSEIQLQTRPSLFDIFEEPLAIKMLHSIRTSLQSGQYKSFTYQVKDNNGDKRWYEARIAPLDGRTDQLSRVVWIDREITEQVQLYQKVEQLANTDPLTGLANRRHFFTLAQGFLDRYSSQRLPCAFILIDVDHFKEVNDKFGHLIGDEVLNLVANRLKQQVRAKDIVARYGGEEFAVFLPNTSQAEAEQVAQRLCRTIASEPFTLRNTLIQLSISVGLLSTSVDRDVHIDRMIEKADDALYAAKRAGRNTVKVYPVCSE